MVKLCVFAFFALFIAFCFLNSMREANSASNQYLGRVDCKQKANFALELLKDKNAAPDALLNVMPSDQHILDLVEAHRGTRDELWKRVYHDCADLRT